MTGHLHITAGYKNHRTCLRQSFCEQPFKLANVTEDKSAGLLQLMIMSSSPGILDNDKYCIEISIEGNARLHLTTQGYQRLFSMGNKASQHTNVRLHDNASFCFLPHPCVPYTASDFSSVNNVYLQKKHRLIWSEILTCGRKLSGEEFMFTRYQNVTNIYLCDRLVVKENILLEPFKKNIRGMGQLEGYTHQSTLLFMNDHADIKKISLACNELLCGIDNIAFGISALPVNGLIFRILGYKGEKLFNCNNDLASLIQQLSDDNLNSEPAIITSATF